MKDLKEYEVKFTKYDYFFGRGHETKYDFITAKSLDEAKRITFLKYGDLIEIISLKEEI